ncbi:helix-turn-helix domain-containing protein [Thalassotalea profundi]|uniref:helix-turn-helix domain-containing protein n=1 Tax=Thalassotalea profundi TaxID=2036687 RepID=UPI0035710869
MVPLHFLQAIKTGEIQRGSTFLITDRTYISMLERGKRQPTLKTIFTLCDKLNCSPSEMMKHAEIKAENTP